jgi:hypothetical protein
MAVALSRHFIRSISQPYDHSITGISVWTYEQLMAKQTAEKVRLEDIDLIVLKLVDLIMMLKGSVKRTLTRPCQTSYSCRP